MSLLTLWRLAFTSSAVLLLALASCGSPQEPESRSTDGILMNCGQGVTCTEPCFCERTCILWWCWGKPYCECRS